MKQVRALIVNRFRMISRATGMNPHGCGGAEGPRVHLGPLHVGSLLAVIACTVDLTTSHMRGRSGLAAHGDIDPLECRSGLRGLQS